MPLERLDMQHLYVMQNHVGLIKIGRSKNVEVRRRRLEIADNCKIEIVAVIENGGELEKEFHARMRRHRAYGEWYEGGNNVRKGISKLFGLPRNLKWPVALLGSDAISNWLDELGQRRERESADKLLQRCIRDLAGTPDECRSDSRGLDAKIWSLLIRFEHGVRPFYSVLDGEYGQESYEGWNPVTECREVIPFYLTDLNAALGLWPADERPKQWECSAWDCCVLGLKARKAHIRTKGHD